ncbi:MAG TPA: SDR family NAD(P)-dependent oxidoreductase [Negativicutes bacterium]|nr:SDR family NAD(P)-dependent oxidoreductase [Negativicutes bacterium]
MDFNLKGKVAIVTGGGSGLGAAISQVLAAEGCNVVVNYIADEANTFRFVDSLKGWYSIL